MPSSASAKRTQAKRPAKKAAARPAAGGKGQSFGQEIHQPPCPGPADLLVRAIELFFTMLWAGASRSVGHLARRGRRGKAVPGMATDLAGARPRVSGRTPCSRRCRASRAGCTRTTGATAVGLLLIALGLIVSAAIFHKMPGWLGQGASTRSSSAPSAASPGACRCCCSAWPYG